MDTASHDRNHTSRTSHCCGTLGRRQFLTRLGALGGAGLALNLGLFRWSTHQVLAAPKLPGAEGPKPRIRIGFSRPDMEQYWMGWPGAAYDIEASQKRYIEVLEKAAAKQGVELDIEHAPLADSATVDQFIEETQARQADGALLTVMALHPDGWSPIRHFLEHRDELPTVVYSPQGTQFTPVLGEFRQTPRFFLGATADVEWLADALRLLSSQWKMAHTRIAVIAGDAEQEQPLEPIGTVLHHMPLAWFAEAYDATADSEEAKAIARIYTEKAKGILEPTDEEIVEAARTYVANRQIMEETGCHAVTMDCLGLVGSRRTPPPCMAYMQLLDEGTCGCCEADWPAGLSLLLSSYLCDRPAFLHNPTPNTVRNTYGGAHCTAPSLMDGFDADPEEFILRSHHESDWGVAPQVLFREGQPATVMKFISPDTYMIATGTILHNIDTQPDDGVGGCRTAFEMRMDDVKDVRDIRGHHNVLIYGDHLHAYRAWAKLTGVTIEHITGGSLV